MKGKPKVYRKKTKNWKVTLNHWKNLWTFHRSKEGLVHKLKTSPGHWKPFSVLEHRLLYGSPILSLLN